MKVFKHKPSNPGFQGYVEVKIPSYRERITMAQEMGLSSMKDANVEAQLQGVLGLLDKISEHVVSVDLKWNEDGHEEVFTSLADLEYFAEGVALTNEIGALLVQGISLGKKLEVPSEVKLELPS